MVTLTKGANAPISSKSVRAVLEWQPTPGSPDVDVSALLLGGGGKVRSDADFVFYNAPRHASGAVTHIGKQGSSGGPAGGSASDTVEVQLDRLEPGIERVVIAASADGGPFGRVPGLRLRVTDAATGAELVSFEDMGAGAETAFVVGELYLRAGAWKFRAVGQGWSSGLAGLASDFGITVDDAPAPAAAQAPSAPDFGSPAPSYGSPAPSYGAPAPAPAAPPSGVVNLDKGRVCLRKGERVILTKSGAPALTQVVMGLGWDPAAQGKDIDLDASVIAYDAGGAAQETVWFMQLEGFGGAIQHAGDSLTGEGDGDDEQIKVDLSRLPTAVHGLVFVITSFRGHKFTDVRNAFCRLVDGRSGTELVRFDLSESKPNTGVVMATLTRSASGHWVMAAVGTFHDAKTARTMVDVGAAALRG
jgi:stress response protein SCP2